MLAPVFVHVVNLKCAMVIKAALATLPSKKRNDFLLAFPSPVPVAVVDATHATFALCAIGARFARAALVTWAD